MYQIKLEENNSGVKDQVNIYFNVHVGIYNNIKRKYKINLNNKTYSYYEADDEVLLDWEEILPIISEEFENFLKTVEGKILNNRTVIASCTQCGKEKEVEKAKKHLEKNIIVLEYLENIKEEYVTKKNENDI